MANVRACGWETTRSVGTSAGRITRRANTPTVAPLLVGSRRLEGKPVSRTGPVPKTVWAPTRRLGCESSSLLSWKLNRARREPGRYPVRAQPGMVCESPGFRLVVDCSNGRTNRPWSRIRRRGATEKERDGLPRLAVADQPQQPPPAFVSAPFTVGTQHPALLVCFSIVADSPLTTNTSHELPSGSSTQTLSWSA